MVTHIRKRARPHLYITEWMEHLGLDDDQICERVGYWDKEEWIEGVTSTTIYRWAREQWRLDPFKIEDLAYAMGLDGPESLYQPPQRPSVDAALKGAPESAHAAALAVALSFGGKKAS